MEPRRSRKEFRKTKHYKETGLSYGVMNMDAEPRDKDSNNFFEFLIHAFLFLVGGIILCAMLLAILSFS